MTIDRCGDERELRVDLPELAGETGELPRQVAEGSADLPYRATGVVLDVEVDPKTDVVESDRSWLPLVALFSRLSSSCAREALDRAVLQIEQLLCTIRF